LKIVELLIENGANVNAAMTNGWTSLISASQKGRLEVARLLITHGANVNAAMTDDGNTSLMQASLHGHLDVVKLLLENGANVNAATTTYGVTSLMRASEEGHLEVARLLIKHGANLNEAANPGWTSLMEACQKGHLEVARLLIKHGANVNAAQTDNGMTSLMWASEKGHLNVVKLLLENGADINKKDNDNLTALDYARDWRHTKVAKFLGDFLIKNATNRKGVEYKTRKALENVFEHHGHNIGMSRNVANPISELILSYTGDGLSPKAAQPHNTSRKERQRVGELRERIGNGLQWRRVKVGGSRKTKNKRSARKTRKY
jgi:ankyrin repeat protein